MGEARKRDGRKHDAGETRRAEGARGAEEESHEEEPRGRNNGRKLLSEINGEAEDTKIVDLHKTRGGGISGHCSLSREGHARRCRGGREEERAVRRNARAVIITSNDKLLERKHALLTRVITSEASIISITMFASKDFFEFAEYDFAHVHVI